MESCEKNYQLGQKIGEGSFGEVFRGTDMLTNEVVAIKLEDNKRNRSLLLRESKVYKILLGEKNDSPRIPKMIYFGVGENYNVLVLDLLGPNLKELFNSRQRSFSLKTVLMLADQLITLIEYLHSMCILHRDVKPQNFLMGVGSEVNQVYVIDFGLSKLYQNRFTYEHRAYRDHQKFVGTARYSSMNTHLGIRQSRRDDLESLGYVLVYFLRGSLPWEGITAATKKKLHQEIGESKRVNDIETICESYPSEFALYFRYCRSLGYDVKPDYAYLKKIFRDLFNRQLFELDYVFDWTVLKS